MTRQRQTNVLVLAPHPDDESIGCGGTLRQHVLEGAAVHVMVLTSGEKGGHGRDEADTRRVREAEARAAAAILGVREPEFWQAPDGALRVTAALVRRLAATLCDLQPQFIYLPHEAEAHPDHVATVRLLRWARKQVRLADWEPEIRCYEIWTPITELAAIVDISPHVETKRAAIRCHESQCAVLDFEAAALGLNRYRGEMHSWPGGDYAEVFARFRS